MVEREIRDRVRELRRVKASELVPNPKNWRRHPKEQAAALKGLLAEVGYADALIVRELPDGRLMLIDGHLRAETTKNATVPVLVLDVTEAEADKLLLTLDPLAAMALADQEQVMALLETVRTDSQAVAALLERVAGQEAWQAIDGLREIVDPPAAINKADELRAKWGTETGQLWRIGAHRILCADCRDEAAVRRLWGDNGPRLRMIWTDPPYGVDYAAKNAYLNRSDRGNRIQVPIENDKLTAGETGFLFKAALSVAKDWAHTGATVYATVPSGPLLIYFVQALTAAGFTFRAQLAWVKQQFVIGMADYHHRFEPILYGWLPDGAHYFIEDRRQDDVFEIDKPHVNDLHPTTKPVELIARMVRNSSREGELVYDPFCGSGSTLLAAHQLERIGYGVEIDPGYLAVTLERFSMLGLKPELMQ
ncbi:MAG: DNA methyltransferase [Candidatus Binataceae bacterium]